MSKHKKEKPQIDSKDQKIVELDHALKRALADFENFRKRVENERQGMASYAKVRIIEDLLPIIDNFTRAINHLPNNLKTDGWASGIQAIYRQFEDFLAGLELQPIKPDPGTPFDPKVHEAISHEPNETIATDHILETIETGYSVNGQVIRPAKVRVSSGNSSSC
jgi:molecular chaperone GrpE